MYINLTLIFILVPLLYLLLPLLILVLVKRDKVRKNLVVVLLIIFSVFLSVGVFGNFDYTDKYFHIYFDFSYNESKVIDFDIFNNGKIDMLINILMLIPIGIAIVALNFHKKKRTIILLSTIGFGVGLFIEFFQFILPINRAVQVVDILLNGLSVVLGGIIGLIYISISNFIHLRKK